MNLHRYLYNSLNTKLNIENSYKDRIREYPLQSSGKVIYSPAIKNVCDPSWVILECDKGIIDYYKWFLTKKGVKLDALMWGSHISIIRGGVWDRIEDEYKEYWKFNNGQIINFKYGDLVTNGVHWWLEVQSEELEEMRKYLGLNPHPDFGFHITIGKISAFR